MADSQGSGNSEFSERSFLGTPDPNVRSTQETTVTIIPEILTFLADEESSVHSSSTPEQVPEVPASTPATSPAASVTSVAMTTKDVVIDGPTIKVNTVQKIVVIQTVLHPKAERASLDKKERNNLYVRATANHHKQFDSISLAITSEDKLDDTYNLEMLIEHMISFHGDYEMGDFFKIINWGVNPATNDLKINGGTRYLYSDYSNLTVENVAQSNELYRTCVDDETFTENLKLTLDYMKNNVTENLWNKVL
jgi:hypothetical protein